MGGSIVGENVQYLEGPIQNLTAVNFGSSGGGHRENGGKYLKYSLLA
jgi:hypothetical protein